MSIFERNLSALSCTHPSLIDQIRSAHNSTEFEFILSRTGHPVPIKLEAGMRFHLNSRYDPVTEARRIVDCSPKSTAYLILGLDGGYLAPILLSQPVEMVILIIEDIAYLRLLLSHVDLSEPFLDPRLLLISGKKPVAAVADVQDSYIPFLHGDLTLVQVGRDNSYNGQFRTIFTDFVSRSALDVTTQALFGRRWLSNISANASQLGRNTFISYDGLEKESGKRVHVTAAGPSLESSLSQLPKESEDAIIVATDTSLPLLISENIVPDYVISVDCQNHSYHHFIAGVPASTKIVLDLASPNLLYRIPRHIIPVAGGHPFAKLLVAHYYPFPEIDTSGGNVTQAAVSFSVLIGASEVVLHGADFSYPQGKLYARGTYCYPLFQASQLRTHPFLSHFARMLMNRGDLSAAPDEDGSLRYTTDLLSSYKASFEAYARTLGVPVVTAKNNPAIKAGEILTQYPAEPKAFQAPVPKTTSWQDFCGLLISRLTQIKLDAMPVNNNLHNLDTRDRNILTAAMPLAACRYRQSPGSPSFELLRMALDDAREILLHSLPTGVHDAAISDK